MSNCCIVGVNWGDEGKGRMVDLITKDYDIVIRYQGGGNAGHTVINDQGKFVLHILPSGVLTKGVVNVLGNGVALDPENLLIEMETLKKQGVDVTPLNLKISERASILLPYNRLLDELEEERLADKKYGSTKQGIAPFYSDKFQKKTIMAGELFDYDQLLNHLYDLLEWKNLTITGVYKKNPISKEEIKDWVDNYLMKIKPFVTNTTLLLEKAVKDGKNILCEAQLGALRDIDFGIYPMTTSSYTLASFAPIGSGLPSLKLDKVIGVMKAYSTCVGEGAFVSKLDGVEAHDLREAGGEYGAKTGRPRTVGSFDCVASKYGIEVQGCTDIALTKLDVLSYMEKIPVCVAYKLNGEIIYDFPFPTKLKDCTPVIEYLPGFKTDISKCRRYEDLPLNARRYIEFIEEKTGCHITYVSVGADRDAMIIRK